MTILVPYLYIIGYFTHQGHLSEFGLTEEQFPKTMQEYLTSSFLICAVWILDIFKYVNEHWIISSAVFLLVLPISVAALYSLKNEDKIKDRFSKFIKERPISDYLWIPPTIAISILISIFSFMFLALLTVAIPAYGFKSTAEMAQLNKKNFVKCELKQKAPVNSCIYGIAGGKPIFSGMYVARSATHIAIWNGSATEVIPLTGQKLVVKLGEKKS